MTRRWLLVCLLLIVAPFARADDKRFRTYAGKIVISPDPLPNTSDELLRYLDANLSRDGRYELIDGPPWPMNLIGVLSKDPGSRPVTLVFIDIAADKNAAPLQSIEVSTRGRMVVATTSATTAAGFEADKTYIVQLVADGKPLARAELSLRHH